MRWFKSNVIPKLTIISTHRDPDVRMRITHPQAVIFDFPGPKKILNPVRIHACFFTDQCTLQASPAPLAVCLCWIFHCGSVKSVERVFLRANTPVGLKRVGTHLQPPPLWVGCGLMPHLKALFGVLSSRKQPDPSPSCL